MKGLVIPDMEICGCINAPSPDSIGSFSENWAAGIKKFKPWKLEKHISGPVVFDFYTTACPVYNYPVFIFENVSSVMDAILQLNEKKIVSEWGSAVSVIQTGGRGRLGRNWVSIPGNLHAALILPDVPEEFAGLEAVISAIAIICYLEKSGLNATLKWPNDIIIDEKKVAGILVEKKRSVCIAGIGINLCACPDDSSMRKDCAFPAGIAEIPFNPGGLLGIWVDIVEFMRGKFAEMFFSWKISGFIAKMEEKLLWKGQNVRIVDSSEEDFDAEIIGINSSGGLRLMTSKGEKNLFSGRVVRL